MAKRPSGEQEVEQYLSSGHSLQHSEDLIPFWIEQEKKFPLLASLAIDMLVTPGSSAPIERTFSTTGELSSGKRNRKGRFCSAKITTFMYKIHAMFVLFIEL